MDTVYLSQKVELFSYEDDKVEGEKCEFLGAEISLVMGSL